jgi:hypothetical protein
MSDILTEVFKVTIEGILVLNYAADETAPDPSAWPLETLVDTLSMTMNSNPTVTLKLVYHEYPSMEEGE